MPRRRKPRIGRPPLPPEQAKRARMDLRLTLAQRDLIRRAARKATEGDVTAFVLDAALVRAAEELGEDPAEALRATGERRAR